MTCYAQVDAQQLRCSEYHLAQTYFKKQSVIFMLKLHPNCEYCDKDLPPESLKANICSYECTFCSDCVNGILKNVCPNCGGGFVPRPIRPKMEHRPGENLNHHPASTIRINTKYSREEIAGFCNSINGIAPEDR